jgi:hypothetical protein
MPGQIALNETLPFGRNFIRDLMMKTAISLNRGERAFMHWRLLFIWFLPELHCTSQNKTRMSLFTIPRSSRAAEPFRNWCFFCLWRARTVTDRITRRRGSSELTSFLSHSARRVARQAGSLFLLVSLAKNRQSKHQSSKRTELLARA